VVLIPRLDAALDAVPLENILVGVADHAGFQRDQRIRNLERRRRQERLPGAIGVAGDDQIVVGLVADEGADRARLGEPFCKIVTDFTALRRDVSESARRRGCSGGEQTESEAAIDQGSTGGIENSRTMRGASW
jgi:hypothetical protein